MRLIDADAIEYTHITATRTFEDGHKWYELCATYDEIADMPTVDLRKVTQDYASDTTIEAVPTEFIMENCNLEFVCDELTDDGEWCSEHCQYSEPQPECIHRYIDRIWRKEHDRKAIDEEIERAWWYAKTD